MSTHHLGCCCPTDVPPLSCDDSCFATSYSLSGIQGTYYYEKTRPDITDDACACPPGISREVYSEYFVTVTFSQNGTDTLTRSGAGQCCYEARGDLTVTASVRIVQYSWCCSTSSYTVNDQSFTRTEEAVPYCFTMQCVTNSSTTCARTIAGPDRWHISLSICDFPLAESVDFIYENDDPADCPPSALQAYGLIVGGAVFRAFGKLKAPDRIQFNEWAERHDFDAANRCLSGTIPSPAATACDPNNDSVECMPGVVYHAGNYGNFAIFARQEFSPQDPPAYCSLACTGAPPIASADAVYGAFTGSGATLVPCINVETNWSDVVCDYGAIRSGGWDFEIG